MINSSQKATLPHLQAGEHVTLQSQGSYKHNLRSGWKIAQCFLTNQRFIIYQRPAIRFEVALSDIKGLKIERLHYVIRKKECLCLFFRPKKRSEEARIWLITNDPENWRKAIYQASLLKIDPETIDNISAQLSADGLDILWYLWEKRHAKIDQLAELIDAPNHMHVLMEIRETINPVAEKIVGFPVLSFERSKIDPETGEPVLFSWWLAGQPEERTRSEDRLLDIFDEGSHIQVIMEIKGVEQSDLALEVEGGAVMIRSQNIGDSLKETVRLPAEVDPHKYQMHLKNNLLEIRLAKVKRSFVSK